MVLTSVLVLMDPSTELTELCPEPEAGSGEISLEASKQCCLARIPWEAGL